MNHFDKLSQEIEKELTVASKTRSSLNKTRSSLVYDRNVACTRYLELKISDPLSERQLRNLERSIPGLKFPRESCWFGLGERLSVSVEGARRRLRSYLDQEGLAWEQFAPDAVEIIRLNRDIREVDQQLSTLNDREEALKKKLKNLKSFKPGKVTPHQRREIENVIERRVLYRESYRDSVVDDDWLWRQITSPAYVHTHANDYPPPFVPGGGGDFGGGGATSTWEESPQVSTAQDEQPVLSEHLSLGSYS